MAFALDSQLGLGLDESIGTQPVLGICIGIAVLFVELTRLARRAARGGAPARERGLRPAPAGMRPIYRAERPPFQLRREWHLVLFPVGQHQQTVRLVESDAEPGVRWSGGRCRSCGFFSTWWE
jgi:hypothetical protein